VHWKKCLDSKPTFPQGNRKKRRIGNKKQDLAIISIRHLGKGLTRKNNINSTENTKHRKEIYHNLEITSKMLKDSSPG
jgi:hypothetical protein